MVVIEGSRLESRGFDSQHQILDGHDIFQIDVF